MIAALGPTPFWYATRGSGFTALVLLTASVVLGLVTSARWTAPRWPRFVSQALHRNLSLFAVLFLLIHIATSIIDPFARLNLRDAILPVGAGYRPLWLGLGVIGMELFVAVLVTSIVRSRLSFAVWRAVHLLAYISWPVAVLHGIGTGTDTKAAWAILLVAACAAAVAVTLVWRLSLGWPAWAALRVAGIAISLAAIVALAAWTVRGPLQPGWARAAGTPSNLLAGSASVGTGHASRTPTPALTAGLNDQLSGTVQRSPDSVTVQMSDQRDTSLTVDVVARADGSGTLTIARGSRTVCSAAAVIGNDVRATCGTVAVTVQVFGTGPDSVSGSLVTQATAP